MLITADNKRIYLKKKQLINPAVCFSPKNFNHIVVHDDITTFQVMRHLVKYLDNSLAISGTAEVKIKNLEWNSQKFHGFIGYSNSQIKHEFSIGSAGRLRLINEVKSTKYIHLKYIKNDLKISIDNKMTIGVLSSGSDEDEVKKMYESIPKRYLDTVEFVLCGPVDFHLGKFIYHEFDENYQNIRINEKKNLILKNSSNPIVGIFHARYTFHADFFSRILSLNGNFEFLTFPNIDTKGLRVNDRPVIHNRFQDITLKIPGQLKNGYSSNSFMPGGCLFGRRDCFEKVELREDLCWDEMEDVHLSRLIQLNGYLISHYFEAILFTESKRLLGTRDRMFLVKSIHKKWIWVKVLFIRLYKLIW